MRLPLALGTCWLATLGCSNGLDAYQSVKDLRVLSMHANPPELANNSPIPLQTSLVATVLDPRGGTLDYTWSLCPIQSDVACDDFEDQVRLMDPNTQAMMRKLRAVQVRGTASPASSGPGLPFTLNSFDVVQATSDTYPGESYDVGGAKFNLTAFLWTHFLNAGLFNQGQGAWPSVILDLQSSHGDRLRAAKRVVLGVLDYGTVAAPLLAQLGIQVCPANGPQPAGCLTLPAHSVNNNPDFDKVLWATDVNGPWQDTELTKGVHVRVNQQILLQPVPKAGSYESYTQIEADVQTQSLRVIESTEDLTVSWFCAYGELLNQLTWPKYTASLLNRYTAPSAVPDSPKGVDELWLVIRDLRGGEAVLNLPIFVDP